MVGLIYNLSRDLNKLSKVLFNLSVVLGIQLIYSVLDF